MAVCMFRQVSAEMFYFCGGSRGNIPEPTDALQVPGSAPSREATSGAAVAVGVKSISLKIINARSVRFVTFCTPAGGGLRGVL